MWEPFLKLSGYGFGWSTQGSRFDSHMGIDLKELEKGFSALLCHKSSINKIVLRGSSRIGLLYTKNGIYVPKRAPLSRNGLHVIIKNDFLKRVCIVLLHTFSSKALINKTNT